MSNSVESKGGNSQGLAGCGVPRLKKRTRHWCNHGLEGSMATALFID